MKSITPLRLLVLSALATPLLASVSIAQDGVTSAEKIRAKVVEPELTRAWPKTRKGYSLETTRSAGGDRSLAAVEVKVDASANIALPNIEFKLGSTEPANAESWAQLNQLAAAFTNLPEGAQFLIEGHTCSLGADETNNRLSAERAAFVVDYLAKQGVPATALRSMGCGAAEARKEGVTESASEFRLAPYRKVMVHKVVQ